ncbi:hypothetical protein SRRS_24030 [Sporomusa rhizae]|uniref:general stress protein n=1 Tax=Sporomusa rhizae TaxID=357999 RepID=UPI00352A444B
MVMTNNGNMNNQTSNQTMSQTSGQAGSALVSSYTNAQTQTGSNANQQANTNANANTSASANASQQGNQQNVKSVIGVFNSKSNAEQAVSALRNQGFTTEEINIVSKNHNKRNRQDDEFYEDDVTDGALTGGTLGGIGGLLLGAGALAIPGVGPVIAAGPIAAALSGAVAGGIAGGLIDWGIPAEAGRRYEQEVAQGGILAVIRADASKANQAAQLLRQNGAKDVEMHAVK